MAKKSSFKIPGLSFSWKRALGITSAKRKIAKATGIPTTKAGRQRKAASYWGLSESHRRLFHIVPTAPAPDGGDFLPPIAVIGFWPHTHSISLMFGKSIQKPDNIRLADKNKRRGLPEIRQEGKKWKKLCRIFAEMQKRTSILPRKT